ncbi:MAG: ABC transporter ATP-binding protein [Desulfobulbaceae bacterium]|uniref:ABC transporter ATP-binding protein n=1 Tax=Candidatus Desulfatifera sulfidica TaxID=2841691 RepID=A0A8J6N7G1_9BACT|nr:ABC transporter ATP-binding protein [Candidatus Desulfatifera sulfidica]
MLSPAPSLTSPTPRTLEVQDLSFTYGNRTVLDRISFKVGEGEILAILGPNGAGKTTLLRCVNLIHRPASGRILVNNEEVREMSANDVARRIAYVAQQNATAGLTVFDAVLMGRRPHLGWRVADKDLRMVGAALEHLGLNQLAMRPINQLSGGELQKTAIARALVQEPRLLLLDEPTSALDVKNQYEILGLLQRVVHGHEMAAVLTLHDLNLAMRFAHKFLLLKDGKIFAHGQVEDINPEMIREVYGLEVAIHQLDSCAVMVPHKSH